MVHEFTINIHKSATAPDEAHRRACAAYSKYQKDLEVPKNYIKDFLEFLPSAWFLWALEAYHSPALALFGGKDFQVSAAYNAPKKEPQINSLCICSNSDLLQRFSKKARLKADIISGRAIIEVNETVILSFTDLARSDPGSSKSHFTMALLSKYEIIVCPLEQNQRPVFLVFCFLCS
jgi:hypothetical protein